MNIPIVSIRVVVRRVWCVVEAFHDNDTQGDFTLIEVATTDGALMFEAEVDGLLSAVQVHLAASDLVAGKQTSGVSWIDLNVAAAA